MKQALLKLASTIDNRAIKEMLIQSFYKVFQ